MYCPVQRLYTITREAFISRQKQMSLPSSCLGVHQWKPAVRCGLYWAFNELCTALCRYMCVCTVKKSPQYLCEHTRENNKESGRENAPDGNAAVHGDVDSRPWEGKPAGGGQDFFPLGLQSQKDQQKDRQTEHRCMIGSRAKAKATAASYLCSPASPLSLFTMHHCLSHNSMISFL